MLPSTYNSVDGASPGLTSSRVRADIRTRLQPLLAASEINGAIWSEKVPALTLPQRHADVLRIAFIVGRHGHNAPVVLASPPVCS